MLWNGAIQIESVNNLKLGNSKTNQIKSIIIIKELEMLASATSAFNSIENREPAPLAEKAASTQENLPAVEHALIISTSPMIKPEHRVQLKITFQKYSRIHYYYKLRTSTLFHATSLYINCLTLLHQKKLKFSQDYLTIVCLFLSMKYEEIYPPKLHHITSFIKSPPVDLAIYRQEERKILNLIDGDLDVGSLKETMDQYLLKQSNQTHEYAYYLLELSLFDILIPSTFQPKEICLAILFISKQTQKLSHIEPELEKEFTKSVMQCAKLIASAKDRFKNHELEYIYRKYSRYENSKALKQHGSIVGKP